MASTPHPPVPPRHAPTPSMSSAHSHQTSYSSAYSTLPPSFPPHASSQHGHSNSLSSGHAHTSSIGHGQPPSIGYASSLGGHGRSPSQGPAPPLTPIKELASARPSPVRPSPTAAQRREAEESGAPTTGIYAQSGFWDDDSDDNEKGSGSMSWRARLSGSTSSNIGDRRSVKSTKSNKSGGGRSRSNTLNTPVNPSPSVEGGPWPWARKVSGPVSGSHHGRVPSMVESAAPGSRPNSAQRPPSAAQVFASPVTRPPSAAAHTAFPAAHPSPATTFPSPTSTAFPSTTTHSSPSLPSHPALPEVPQLKQRKSRLRLRSKTTKQNEAEAQDLKTPVARPPLSPVTNVGSFQVTSYPSAKGKLPTQADSKPLPVPTADPKSKSSSWKRGMERLFRSKSAGNIRNQYRHQEQENLPPVPTLPREHAHENVRARLVSQTGAVSSPSPALAADVSAASPRPLSPAALSPAAHAPSPSVSSPMLSPPLTLCPDLSNSTVYPSSSFAASAGLMRASSRRSDVDDPVMAELDQRYPSYRAHSPRSPIVNDEDLENDPFASAIDYSQPRTRLRSGSDAFSPRALSPAPVRSRSPGPSGARSPVPVAEFGALPPPPPLEDPSASLRSSPSLISLKQSLVPRLRKSKSMGLARRPSSILGAFGRREGGASWMSRAASPAPAPVDEPSTPERTPGLDELVQQAMGQSPLAPPRPLFYDSFDLGDDGSDKEEEDQTPLGDVPLSGEPLERVETMELPASRSVSQSVSRSASPHPRTSSPSQAPDLSIDTQTAVSVSGSSIELATPAVSHHHASGGRMSPAPSSGASVSSGRIGRDKTATPTSDLRGDIYGQQCLCEEALARTVAEKAHRRDQNPTPDDRSETCPSTFGSQSWEAAIAAFPTIDDPRGLTIAPNNDTETGPGQRESLASNPAVATTDTEANTHNLGDNHPLRSCSSLERNAPSRDATSPSDLNCAMWSSWRDVPGRMSGRGGSRSSHGSTRDQPARTVEGAGAWDDLDSDSSEGEDEDVPLGSLHPEAAAAQQQREAEAKKRREARRAARKAKKEAELRRSKSAASAMTSRRPREWNGEGVHPDALAGQLERVAVSSTAPPVPSRALRPPPSDPRNDRSDPGTPLSRSTTLGRSSTGGHSSRSGHSSHRVASEGDALSRPRDAREREPQHRIVSEGDGARSAAVSRAASTTASPANSVAHRRPRAHSNVGRMPFPTPPSEPTPVRRSVPVRCMIAEGSDVRPCTLEAYPETTARDVLTAARQRGDIGDGNWVVFESFAELGLERQVREHEVILSGVTRGWDSSHPHNAIVIREVAPHNVWTRSIPDPPPMVSSWVQAEIKPGKWAKRWLDVRGGQVFLSKNEKGKEEVHVSTLFTDVYTVRQAYNAPMPYIFALKRLDAAASFQNPTEYINYVATDDAAGWKLHSAIFASRSYAMAQADPSVKSRLASSSLTSSTSSTQTKSSLHRAPTVRAAPAEPLIDRAGRVPLLPDHGHHHSSPMGSGSVRRPQRSNTAGPKPLVDLDTRKRAPNPADAGFTGTGLLARVPNHPM